MSSRKIVLREEKIPFSLSVDSIIYEMSISVVTRKWNMVEGKKFFLCCFFFYKYRQT